jgi:DNA modification methylase
MDFLHQNTNVYWDKSDTNELKMHKIHAYPAKFPAFLTQKAINFAQEEGVKINLLADIFCGCGTSALEARRSGINFWGCDINPIATLIAKTKSAIYEPATLDKLYNLILHKFELSKLISTSMDEINPRIKYWFTEENIIELMNLKQAIQYVTKDLEIYQNFFLCCFSNILKATSNWLTKSIKPQSDPNKTPSSVITAFSAQYEFMRDANNELRNEELANTQVEIHQLNFLKYEIEKPFVDLLISSPPYVTSYEYADLHQLSTLWLEFTEDYRDLRKGTIGSIYNIDLNKNEVKNIFEPGKSTVNELWKIDTRKAKAVLKYYIDIQKAVSKCKDIIARNGMALFVIGDTEYKGVRVQNSIHLENTLVYAGFTNVRKMKRKITGKNLTPYRDKLGRFSSDKTERKVYAEEFVIVGRNQ